jgi:anthranilate synthase component II
MHVLFIDNFDSFSFNLVDELARRGAKLEVWRNDIAADEALERAAKLPGPRLLVLSPGPGAPADAGCCVELVQRATLPVFGICLGHQAIVEAYGGRVGFAGEVVHGKAARITHDDSALFAGLPSPMLAARYHSLAALELPEALAVTARCDDIVMAVAHRSAPVIGVQFHPESILTPHGGLLMDNLLAWAAAHDRALHDASSENDA